MINPGVVLIDKPAGPSSFAMVRLVRRALGVKKVGHAGTLDPFATGLLIIGIGRAATRIIPRLMATDKQYEAELALGVETNTQDREGRVTAVRPVPELTREGIEECLRSFLGPRMQAPPAFSAAKFQGRPLYAYARAGTPVAKEPRPIEIKALECLQLGPGTLRIRVVCSKGTYIRSLAADIGAVLGCGAHLTALRRLSSGPFAVAEALPGEQLAEPQTARLLLVQRMMSVDEAVTRVVGDVHSLK